VSDNWIQRLQGARDATAVLTIATDFLFKWKPAELAELPGDCKPPVIHTADDISAYAYTLGQARCKDDQLLPQLNEMAVFFAAASTRLSQLYAESRASNSGRFFIKLDD
jgi:hypothetical protein